MLFSTVFQKGAEISDRALTAARQLLSLRYWSELGTHEGVVWGKCQGSSIYQVMIDQNHGRSSCNCPARIPHCRHTLGLTLMIGSQPESLPVSLPPDWVESWLLKYRKKLEKDAEAGNENSFIPAEPTQSQEKRSQQREQRVQTGVEQLNVWLNDLIRNGLGELEHQNSAFWNDQAKRMIDAQASGLANRVRTLGELVGSCPNWPEVLLRECSRLKLLLNAYGNLSNLTKDLQFEVRQLIGWSLSQKELEQIGTAVEDDWMVIGQQEEDYENLRGQRSWLIGKTCNRIAVLLQFAHGNRAFAESIPAGQSFSGRLLFYPGSLGFRARIHERQEFQPGWSSFPFGCSDIDALLNQYAQHLSVQPWLARYPFVLQQMTLVLVRDNWMIRDQHGLGLPISISKPWEILAVTGGFPFDLAVEWDGETLTPLSMIHEGKGYLL